MARDYIEQTDFSAGVVTDIAPEDMPPNSLLGCFDAFVDKPGVIYKRGGWLQQTTPVASRYAKLCAYVTEFAGTSLLTWVADNNHLYLSDGTDKGALTGSLVATDVVYRHGGGKNLLVFLGTGAAPVKYNGTTMAALGGTPPSGCKYGAVYKTRLVIGNNSGNPNRMYWSPTPDIEATWDTTNAWIDADYPITGFAPLQNMLLVFTNHQTERLVGTTPPPGTDFDHGIVGPVPCYDGNSIVVWRNNAIFANAQGVWMTNGVGFRDLTAEGGRKRDWQTAMTGTAQLAATVVNNMYFISMLDGSGNEPAQGGSPVGGIWCCDLTKRTPVWVNLTNFRATCFTQAFGLVTDEAYFGTRKGGYLGAMSTIFKPQASMKNDGDGSAVAPVIRTRPIGASLQLKHYGHAYIDHDTRDAGTDNPTWTVAIANGYESQNYSITPPESPLTETTDEGPARITVGQVTKAVSLQLSLSAAAASAEIHGIRLMVKAIQERRLDAQQ